MANMKNHLSDGLTTIATTLDIASQPRHLPLPETPIGAFHISPSLLDLALSGVSKV